MKKKVLAVILGAVMVASMAGCGGSDTKTTDTAATETITLTPPTGADYARLITFQVLIVVLIGLVIVAVGIVVIKKKVLSK